MFVELSKGAVRQRYHVIELSVSLKCLLVPLLDDVGLY